MKRKILIGLLLLAALLAAGVWQRHRILFPLFTTGERLPLVKDAALPADGRPFGEEGYFVIVQLDEQTFAITEPYSGPRNVNYLIAGTDRAILFDAGVGFYDIRPVVKHLTDLPLTFLPSHLHYDHTGQGNYDRIALVDLPHLREQSKGDKFTPNWGQHLGDAEGIDPTTWKIDEWIKPGSSIDLGNRKLTLIYTPGHTDNSVTLYDAAISTMFTADYYSANGMRAFYPTAGMGDYLQTARKLLKITTNKPNTIMRGAHAPESGQLPTNTPADIQTLHDALIRIKSGELTGEGVYPVIYTISEKAVMQAEPSWLQDWSPSYGNEGG